MNEHDYLLQIIQYLEKHHLKMVYPTFYQSQNIDLNAGLKLGESDLTVNGKLQNFIQYIMRDETITGSLKVNSKLLNVTELLGESTESTETEETTENNEEVVEE